MSERPKLRNLSEIYGYLRRNETPIYVITPTPFSLLGLDQWVGSLEFVNYFDIFEGAHPRCFVPSTSQAPEFKSMEDVANYLIDHPDFRAEVKRRPGGKALFVMFDDDGGEVVIQQYDVGNLARHIAASLPHSDTDI
jgi:hypothetical protein